MRHHQQHYKTYLQCGLAIALVAFPLLAYANAETGTRSAESVSSVKPAAVSDISPAVATTRCDGQNWPKFSSDCVRGDRDQVNPRQIELVTNNIPLKSLPRVISAPVTSQHVVTIDARKAVERRRVARRQPPRLQVAVESALAPIAVSSSNDPSAVGW